MSAVHAAAALWPASFPPLPSIRGSLTARSTFSTSGVRGCVPPWLPLLSRSPMLPHHLQPQQDRDPTQRRLRQGRVKIPCPPLIACVATLGALVAWRSDRRMDCRQMGSMQRGSAVAPASELGLCLRCREGRGEQPRERHCYCRLPSLTLVNSIFGCISHSRIPMFHFLHSDLRATGQPRDCNTPELP